MNLALDVVIILSNSNFISLDVILKLSKCLVDDIPLTVRKERSVDLSVQSVVHIHGSISRLSCSQDPLEWCIHNPG